MFDVLDLGHVTVATQSTSIVTWPGGAPSVLAFLDTADRARRHFRYLFIYLTICFYIFLYCSICFYSFDNYHIFSFPYFLYFLILQTYTFNMFSIGFYVLQYSYVSIRLQSISITVDIFNIFLYNSICFYMFSFF